MREETVKAVIIKCSSCGQKHLWTPETSYSKCSECNSIIVKKTVSENVLKEARKSGGHLAFSDYITYSLTLPEIEAIKQKARKKKKK